MKKQQKKRTASKVAAGAIVGVLLFGTGAYAASVLLNWTGSDTMVQTGIFLDQVTSKLIKSEGEKNQAIIDKDTISSEKAELEKEIEDLKEQIKDLEDEIANGDSNTGEDGWTEKDQQIVDLNNQLIEKQNDVAHLTRELQRANEAAEAIQTKLDNAKSRLEAEGINIWN